MANRKKIYYSQSEIEENLFTNGFEWMVFNTWENYVGVYHKYKSTNEVYTEKNWDPNKSLELVPYKDRSKSYFKYVDLKQTVKTRDGKKKLSGVYTPTEYQEPINVLRKPTEKEVKDGVMDRFFVIKRNEINSRLPIEISLSQANTYNVSGMGIDQNIYHLLYIQWKIAGPERDIIKDNIVMTPGVFDTNKRIVERNSKKFPILNEFLSNFVQFSVYDKNI